VPLSGALSDRIGRKPILIAAFLPYLGLAYPLFAWVHANRTFTNFLIMQVVLCSFLGAFYGPAATVLAEQFPAQIRSTAIGVISNVAAVAFGGFAPFYVTWLIAATGSRDWFTPPSVPTAVVGRCTPHLRARAPNPTPNALSRLGRPLKRVATQDGCPPAERLRGFFRKRQNSERPGADRRNYSRPRSHLRAAVAMIGRKSPGLDGGARGVCQDRDLLLGKSGPSLLPWRGELPHKVVIASDGGRQPRQPPFSFTRITRPACRRSAALTWQPAPST
jgi:hypothetical protein